MLSSMFGNAGTTAESVDAQTTADDLLEDLLQAAGNESQETNQRSASRSTDRSSITIEAASTSERGQRSIEGHLRDAGCGGVGTLTTRPPSVGNVYLLNIEDSPFTTDQIFARCMHCRLIREDSFESGFAFFAPATLQEEQV